MVAGGSPNDVDHYKVLGVAEEADLATIKRAYRRAALKNHPDVSDAPDAREQFMKIQEAYSVLSDDKRRASYDRMRRVGFSSSTSGAGFGGFGGFASDTNAAEFARRWRENNPMPEDLNDNFSSIFSDLFSGVADAVNNSAGVAGKEGGGGVVEDFIDFLERRVDGFSSSVNNNNSSNNSSSSSGSNNTERRYGGFKKDSGIGDSNDDDVLRSKDEDVLRAEIDDARFVIDQLRQRRRKAQTQEDELQERVRQWQDRADRADKLRDYDTRDAALDRADDLIAEARRFATRVDESTRHIRKQEARLRRIEERLKEVQEIPPPSPPRPPSQSSASSSSTSDRVRTSGKSNKTASNTSSGNQEDAIDQELDRMKRELGL